MERTKPIGQAELTEFRVTLTAPTSFLDSMEDGDWDKMSEELKEKVEAAIQGIDTDLPITYEVDFT